MLWAAAGIVGLVMMFFGARFAWREYHLGKPSRIWVPLALREDISMEDQKKLAEQIAEKLRTDAILRQVVVDVGLQEKFGQATEDAAVKELDKRLFVEAGTAKTPAGGQVPSINVGLSGTGHENKVLGEASTRIIKDVWLMLGIDPATGRPLGEPAPDPPGSF
ncbi:hypothetical protein HZ994_10145 [Akkermansiaceae bacterium]|nr:hypothetical protein HZ994_10145 [Akkermansiaceae bacterium]